MANTSGSRVEDKPIPGPEPVNPEYALEKNVHRIQSPAEKFGSFVADLVRKPAIWIHDHVVEPNRGPKYAWYHKRYRRALPIDECYLDDYACMYEANVEYRRNKMVDFYTLDILRTRRDDCLTWYKTTRNMTSQTDKCEDLIETYKREETNYFIKYGDLQYGASVLHVYNKQKHRMIMERRDALKKLAKVREEYQSQQDTN